MNLLSRVPILYDRGQLSLQLRTLDSSLQLNYCILSNFSTCSIWSCSYIPSNVLAVTVADGRLVPLPLRAKT